MKDYYRLIYKDGTKSKWYDVNYYARLKVIAKYYNAKIQKSA